MKMSYRRLLTIGLALIAVAIVATPFVEAQTAEAYFKGKTVRVLVGSPPGGGYDLTARMLAPHMAKRLGATVLVENKPGGGALLALSYMLVQPQDGLHVMLASAEAAIMSELLGREGVNWNVTKLQWLAKVSSAPKLWFVAGNSRLNTAGDALKAEQLIWPATAPADNISDVAAVISHAIGLKSKIVVGYKGAGDMALAVIRGEADAGILSADTALKLVQSGQVRPLAVFDSRRWPSLPSVPTLSETAKVDPERAWMATLRQEIGEAQRAMVTAPGVPADRVEHLRKLMAEMLGDPELIEEGKRTNREIEYMPGVELQKLITGLMANASPRVPEFRKVVLETYLQGGGR